MSNMKTKEKCPMRCPELKIKRADVNSRKLLNILLEIENNIKILKVSFYYFIVALSVICNCNHEFS